MLVTTCTRTVLPTYGIEPEATVLAYMVVVLPPAIVTEVEVEVDDGDVSICLNVTSSAPVLALSRLTCVIVTGVVPRLLTTIVAEPLLFTLAEAIDIGAIVLLVPKFAMNPLTKP